MQRVGITGAIGTGKSEVSRILRQTGYPVIVADDVARELTETDPEIRRRLRERFGDAYFDEDGHLRRRELAQLVFSDLSSLRELNQIVHPAMIQEIRRQLDELEAEGHQRAFVEAAVLYEARMAPLFDIVAVVACDLPMAMRRTARRLGITEQEAWQRYRSQIPLEEKIRRADYVIWNQGTLEELEEKVEEFLRWLDDPRHPRAWRD